METEKTELEVLQEKFDAQGFVLKTLSDVFVEYGVAAGCTSSAESLQSLRGWLTDAAAMRAVMRGERKASELLAEMEKFVAPELFYSIVLNLSTYLAPHLQRFVRALMPGDNVAAITAAMLATGLEGWETHRPIFERRMLTVQQIQRKVHQLSTDAGITDRQEIQAVEAQISRAIGDDILALAQVESGNFAEVERLFFERMDTQRSSVQ